MSPSRKTPRQPVNSFRVVFRVEKKKLTSFLDCCFRSQGFFAGGPGRARVELAGQNNRSPGGRRAQGWFDRHEVFLRPRVRAGAKLGGRPAEPTWPRLPVERIERPTRSGRVDIGRGIGAGLSTRGSGPPSGASETGCAARDRPCALEGPSTNIPVRARSPIRSRILWRTHSSEYRKTHPH